MIRNPAPILAALLAALPVVAAAQRPQLSAATRRFVAVDTTVLAIRNVRVIDGTGAPDGCALPDHL